MPIGTEYQIFNTQSQDSNIVSSERNNENIYNPKIEVFNLENGDKVERKVYCNSMIDPYLVIPQGTRVGRYFIKEDKTNLEIMREGKAPFLYYKDERAQGKYCRVELHHMTGREVNYGKSFFGSAYDRGSLLEIGEKKHRGKKNYKVLHILKKRNESFRTDHSLVKQFNDMKKDHWKMRASEYEKEKN